MSKQIEVSVPLVDTPNIDWRTLKPNRTKHVIELINTYGPDILYSSDESGLFPIHWAIVNGNIELVKHMLKVGVSPRLKARIYDEPEPIHFAALEGHIEIIDLLVSYGIDINARDRTGCTPLMRASMFGRNFKTKSSETVLHLISRGADVYQSDNNGHNCLHYSIHNDNEDTVHLLLNLGVDPNQKTKESFKALDFALKTGNEYLIRLLGPLTVDITETDLEILIIKYKKKRLREKLIPVLLKLAKVVVLLTVFTSLLYAYPQYFLYYLPKTSSDIAFHIILIVVNIFIWISWYKTCVSDPGFLPLNTQKYKKIIKSKIESGIQTQVSHKLCDDPFENIRLCHTCKTVKSFRSTHCRYCKRCVASYDHHCIYLSSCIGLKNRLPFFCLGLNILLAGILATNLVVSVALREESLLTPYHWSNMWFTTIFTFIGFTLTVCNLRRAAINLTQNEELKSRRYSYLTDSEGRFVNPFDRGSYLRNIIEYFTTKHYDYSKVNTCEC